MSSERCNSRLTETSAELATWRSMLEQSAQEPVLTLDEPVDNFDDGAAP